MNYSLQHDLTICVNGLALGEPTGVLLIWWSCHPSRTDLMEYELWDQPFQKCVFFCKCKTQMNIIYIYIYLYNNNHTIVIVCCHRTICGIISSCHTIAKMQSLHTRRPHDYIDTCHSSNKTSLWAMSQWLRVSAQWVKHSTSSWRALPHLLKMVTSSTVKTARENNRDGGRG